MPCGFGEWRAVEEFADGDASVDEFGSGFVDVGDDESALDAAG